MALDKSAKGCIRRNKAVKTSSPASETDKSASTSNIYTNLSAQQNQSTQMENTPVSGTAPPGSTTPSLARVQPFCGFTAEQIDAARQRSAEAQNRKEAIIRLMRAKLLNKDDLTIIEPAVLEHRKQKAEQREKIADRYPRRNINRNNYHESSEDDETVDTSTCTFHCDTCKTEYEGHHNCNASGHLSNVVTLELDSRAPFYNAVKSLPDGLLVNESPVSSTGRGVFTRQFTTLRKDTIYGPFEGVRIYNESEAHQSGYCWPIYSKHKISHWIDARQILRSNWLRYIKHAATVAQQNVCAYQVGQNIYYRIVADIGPGTELLIWYGDDYARELGLHSAAFIASINTININGVGFACCECRLEFRCRQLLNRHNRHNFITHSSINSDTVTVVSRPTTRCVSNNVSTIVAKSGATARNGKLTVAESTGSASSGVVVREVTMLHPSGTGPAERNYKPFTHTGEKRFECTKCGKMFKRSGHLMTHSRIHTGEKPFQCTMCGQRFTQNSHLMTHSYAHTDVRPFKCTTCDWRFKRSEQLTTHSRLHIGEKPFECTKCGKRFKRSGYLTTHSSIHAGEKPFECTMCGQRFTQNSHLMTHSHTHTDVRPFQCTTCDWRFRRSEQLTTHSRLHTGEKPFECTICGQRFTQSGNRRKHMRCKHNN